MNYQIKLLMIGDSGVGKTSMLLRYSNDAFSSSFLSTIGVDFKIKYLTIDDKNVKLQIWDTAGAERFRTITTSYFRGAQGILLVYDVTDRNSFNNVSSWLAQINKHADTNVNIVLVGNKCDSENRLISHDEGEKLASQHFLNCFECSAKSGYNINSLYETLTKEVMHLESKQFDSIEITYKPNNSTCC